MTSDDDEELSGDAVVELRFEDVLDLHGFPPRDVREIVQGYLDDADAASLAAVRIVHGRGMGVQRAALRALLARDERVIEFSDAPESQGGRGATLIRLRSRPGFDAASTRAGTRPKLRGEERPGIRCR